MILSFRTEAERAGNGVRLARHLREGGIIACPTETVYGFGCIPEPEPLERLAALKMRSPGSPFLLLVPGSESYDGSAVQFAGRRLEWTPAALRLVRVFWPGPLTVLLKGEGTWPPLLLGRTGAVGIRHSPHAAVAAVLGALEGPMTSTSANVPGGSPAASAEETQMALERLPGGSAVLVADGGPLEASAPSTVVDCSEPAPRVVREGAISLESLRRVVEETHG